METEITSLYPHFKDLDVKINKTYKTINFKGQDIKIAQYLSIGEKIDLIDVAIQKATINGMVHPFYLHMYYKLNIVYLYTDIIFNEQDRADEFKLYDDLYSSGLMNEIIKNMNAGEIEQLAAMLKSVREAWDVYSKSAVGVVETILKAITTELPNWIDQLKDISPENLNMAKGLLDQINQQGTI